MKMTKKISLILAIVALGATASYGSHAKGKYLPHLYDFLYKYASDSGEVPSC